VQGATSSLSLEPLLLFANVVPLNVTESELMLGSIKLEKKSVLGRRKVGNM
jgi:hypothetical protein